MTTGGNRVPQDPEFNKPFIDVDEWRDAPVRHRYVHGGFEGTELLFSCYFPPAEQYGGRFFQPVLAVSGVENAFGSGMLSGMGASVEFAVSSGAYMVESNLGRVTPFPGEDFSVTGYRASSAAAEYSRVLAAEMYGEHRPYGYVYGGSGGGFKTISCMENTRTWDGAVPFILGSPQSLPNVFSVQAHAMRILWHKFPQIVDAVDPGGSGDIFAGLNAEERDALAEVTKMGFPPRAWFDVERIAKGYTGVWSMLGDNLIKHDPTYFQDFWNVDGYLGANPPASLLASRIQHKATVVKPILADEAAEYGLDGGVAIFRTEAMGDIPIALRIDGLPEGSLMGAKLTVTSGKASGHNFWIISAENDVIVTGQGEVHAGGLAGIEPGDEILIDNSDYLAFQTYHRHQVHPDYRVWDQFLAGGKPIYPQRPLVGGAMCQPGSGTVENGRFAGKMILVECLMDEAAYPWQGAFYDELVHKAQPDADDRFRIWMVDHAMHMPPYVLPDEPRPARTTRIVSYGGVLEQALRDLVSWVEDGLPAPASTRYETVDGQVLVPASASERLGVQPVVDVTVNGGRDRIDVRAGEPVTVTGVISVPPSTGTVVAADWDFDGSGDFAVSSEVLTGSAGHLTVTATHTFTEPGTYFPALLAASARHGNTADPHARALNLGRVRVVVS
jgi:hypothetical protein